MTSDTQLVVDTIRQSHAPQRTSADTAQTYTNIQMELESADPEVRAAAERFLRHGHLPEDAPTPLYPIEAVRHQYAVANPDQIPSGKLINNAHVQRGMFNRWTMSGRVYFYDGYDKLRYVHYPIGRLTKYKYDFVVRSPRGIWTYLFSTSFRDSNPDFKQAIQQACDQGLKWALVHSETGFLIEEGELGRFGVYGAEPGGRAL